MTEKINVVDVKRWVYKTVNTLQSSKGWEVCAASLGKRKLAYEIEYCKTGHYIQIYFSSIPHYLAYFLETLKDDPDVLKYILVRRPRNNKRGH